ncbi:hypothetical protein BDB01DRAFT_849878 [Pilobolus umbonatus]|nr:hypothetical protein BDB01DRAFT_849878 [Pilobolus umbonatus]
MSSSMNSISKTIQNKSLPEINKRFNEFQQRARELPSQLVNLQGQLENERKLFVQNKDSSEKSKVGLKSEPIPPWIGFLGYEKQLKKSVMELSKDERNFLISPPEDTHFQFDLAAYAQIAQATLKEDKQLSHMRFLLVPQQVQEPIFWRNYFYRVSMVKQTIMSQPPESDTDEVLFSYEEEKTTDKATEDKYESDEDDISIDSLDESLDVNDIKKEAETDKVESSSDKDEVTKNKKSDTEEDVKKKDTKNITTVKKEVKAESDYDEMEDWEIEMRKAAI